MRSKLALNAFILVFALLCNSSCSTPKTKPTNLVREPHDGIGFEDVSSIAFGTPLKDVVSQLGYPQKAYFLSDTQIYILTYQNVANQPQRSFFEFDQKSKRLINKSYQPHPDEKMSSFQEIQTQFKGAEFYSPPVSMCGSHYARNEGLVYVWGTGVSLRLHPTYHTVESIDWGPIEHKPRNPAQLPTGCPSPGRPVPATEIENPRSLL